jgi:hypothetical protein
VPLCLSLSLSVCGGGALAEPLLERVMQQLLTTLGDRAANASQVRIGVLCCAGGLGLGWGGWSVKGSADVSAQFFLWSSRFFCSRTVIIKRLKG